MSYFTPLSFNFLLHTVAGVWGSGAMILVRPFRLGVLTLGGEKSLEEKGLAGRVAGTRDAGGSGSLEVQCCIPTTRRRRG